MPTSLRFFETADDLVLEENTSAESQLKEVLTLGERVSDISLAHDSSYFLMKRTASLLENKKHQQHDLQILVNFASSELNTIFHCILSQNGQIHIKAYQCQLAYATLVSMWPQVMQSYAAYQIIENIVAHALVAYEFWMLQPLNHMQFVHGLIEFKKILNTSLQNINQTSPLATALTLFISEVDMMISISNHSEVVRKDFIEIIRANLFNLQTQASGWLHTDCTLFGIEAIFYGYAFFDFFMLNQALALNQHTFHRSEQFLAFLHDLLQKNKLELEALEGEFAIQERQFEAIAEEQIELQKLLAKAHEKYLPRIALENKAFHRMMIDTQPIAIKDIMVTHPLETRGSGEIRYAHKNSTHYLNRILLQIKWLSEIACIQHQVNCITNGKLKPHCINNITRLITDEFSFFPSKPLTIKRYTYLLENIYRIATALPENIHLILASFPVLDNANKLHNVTLYVTSGKNALMYHHSKAVRALRDPSYGYELAQHFSAWEEPRMPRIILDKPLSFGFGCIVNIETAGGVRFINNVEICLEHNLNIGTKCLEHEIKRAKAAGEVLPIQYSHVVSSRHTYLMQGPHNRRISQADAYLAGIWSHYSDSSAGSFQPSQAFALETPFGRSRDIRIFSQQRAAYLPTYLLNNVAQTNLSIAKQLDEEQHQFAETIVDFVFR